MKIVISADYKSKDFKKFYKIIPYRKWIRGNR